MGGPNRKRLLISALVIAAGISLVVFGIFRGEAGGVFIKATRICMECIGIG